MWWIRGANPWWKLDCCYADSEHNRLEYWRPACLLVRWTISVNLRFWLYVIRKCNERYLASPKTIVFPTFRATPHRVRFYGETGSLDRYSIALFVHPNSDVKLNPFKSSEERKTKIKEEEDDESSLSAIDYVNKRFSETYIDKK